MFGDLELPTPDEEVAWGPPAAGAAQEANGAHVIRIPNDGQPLEAGIPRILPPNKPVAFDVEYAADGEFVFAGWWLPDTGIAKIRARLDDEEVLHVDLPGVGWEGRLSSPYQEHLGVPFSFPVPKGQHRILLENTGDAWVTMSVDLCNYQTPDRPNVRVYGVADQTRACIWITNRDNTWWRNRMGKTPRDAQRHCDDWRLPAGQIRCRMVGHLRRCRIQTRECDGGCNRKPRVEDSGDRAATLPAKFALMLSSWSVDDHGFVYHEETVMRQSITRREFTRNAARMAGAIGIAMIVPRHVLGGPRQIPPSEKMNVAGIGVGGMGRDNLANLETENIVALCDVDPDYAAPHDQAISQGQGLRRLPRDARPAEGHRRRGRGHARPHPRGDLDGRDEGRQARLLPEAADARRLRIAHDGPGGQGGKVATQMGIQGHSMEGIRLFCEWIWAGVIGEVREVDAWCDLTYYPWGHAGWSSQWSERPKETPPVPAGLNWDLWIGPAPMRPYHRAYHPATWRCWWDFGCGMMGDRGATRSTRCARR